MALALAMVMVLAMGTTVFAGTPAATPKGSIEITSPKTDPNADTTTYEAYKIFDMTTNGATDATTGEYTAVAYTINSAWTAFFSGTAPGAAYLVDANNADGTLNSITVGSAKKYINITDSNVHVIDVPLPSIASAVISAVPPFLVITSHE